jgi:hypothetical protein
MTHFFRPPLRRFSVAAFALLLAFSSPATSDAVETQPQTLIQQGFHSMYNLDFAQATQNFDEWEKLHPLDPMAPVSRAAALLFAEFARLGVLEARLFVDDKTFEARKPPPADPNVKQQFDHLLSLGDQLAAAALIKDGNDTNARFARVLSLGLRSDYAALIDDNDWNAFNYTKQGRKDANILLQQKPDAYDAYIALGVENYLAGIKPAPMRWGIQLLGGSTDKNQGLVELQKTADHGVLLAPFAKLLLAVAAFRDKDNAKGCTLLHELASSYPRNPLYTKELYRCH